MLLCSWISRRGLVCTPLAGTEDKARTPTQAMSAEVGVSDLKGDPPSSTKLWEMKTQTLHLFSINWEMPERGGWLEAVHIDGHPCFHHGYCPVYFHIHPGERNRRDVRLTFRDTGGGWLTHSLRVRNGLDKLAFKRLNINGTLLLLFSR